MKRGNVMLIVHSESTKWRHPHSPLATLNRRIQ
jgi:hypothetical protein